MPLTVVAREWGRIGCIGFGGPPAHIALLRKLCVQDRGWLAGTEFEDGVAACNLLPGPASTQLAIYCAWRLRGPAGALVGGACFIVPGLVVILGLSALFLAARPPGWVAGAALGAGAAVPAVAVAAALALVPASWQRAARDAPRARRPAGAGSLGRLPAGWRGRCRDTRPVAGAGAGRLRADRGRRAVTAPAGPPATRQPAAMALLLTAAGGTRGRGRPGARWPGSRSRSGALSYGGGFVIIPLMQHDAVHTYHWMTAAQFLTAVALGQVTPGPVVQTVAVVGYAAAGVGGGLLAALVAFAPSFAFVLGGAPPLRPAPRQHERSRRSSPARARRRSGPSPGRPSRSPTPWPTCGRLACWRWQRPG